MSEEQLGFVGVGNMGGAMAVRARERGVSGSRERVVVGGTEAAPHQVAQIEGEPHHHEDREQQQDLNRSAPHQVIVWASGRPEGRGAGAARRSQARSPRRRRRRCEPGTYVRDSSGRRLGRWTAR